MLHLKDDMDVSSLTFLGTIAHILGPIYLSECFPKVLHNKKLLEASRVVTKLLFFLRLHVAE